MQELKSIKNHKINFILGANYYMFRHIGAILKEFINNKGSKHLKLKSSSIP